MSILPHSKRGHNEHVEQARPWEAAFYGNKPRRHVQKNPQLTQFSACYIQSALPHRIYFKMRFDPSIIEP
jgi:hypothetical protein